MIVSKATDQKSEDLKNFQIEEPSKKLIKKGSKKEKKNKEDKSTSQRIKGFFSNKEILSKIGVTLVIIVIYRALASIPLPGIDMTVYNDVFGQGTASEINYLFTLFTGGQIDSPSIVGLGLVSFIQASIIMQLMTPVIPRLQQLSKEGERGRQLINQYTRFLTLPFSILYAVGYVLLMSRRDLNSSTGEVSSNPLYLIPSAEGSEWPTITKIIFVAIILSAGTIFLMWLSEIITEKGIGNGSSIIIATGILSSLPALIENDFAGISVSGLFSQIIDGDFAGLRSDDVITLLAVILGALILIVGIVFVNESARKIVIQHSRRQIGADSNLPIKLTIGGVMPIIFASSLMSIPQVIVPIIQNLEDNTQSALYKFSNDLQNTFFFAANDNLVSTNDIYYSILYFILIIAFGIFYTFIVIKPEDTAENLQKSGEFIPGIRPGKATQNFLSYVLLRIGFVGATILGLIALIPLVSRLIVISETGQNLALLSGIGGTSILIIVSVVIDTVRQYRAIRASRNYEKYIE